MKEGLAVKQWLVFSYNGKELLRYSIDGTFAGELKSTIGLLAYQHNISEKDICCRIVKEKRRAGNA